MSPRGALVGLAALAALALRAAAAGAQGGLPKEGAPVAIGTTHVVHSARLEADRVVYVSLPDDYAKDPTRRWPALVLLDADDHFRGTVAIVRFFATRGEMPDMIVLGVSNRNGDRTRDFMPKAGGADTLRFPTAGGADAFTEFLADELLPWAGRRWRVNGLHVLAGHSFGGVLALHASVTRPDVFRVTLALSPSLWWSQGTAARTYADLVRADTGTRTLVVTSGGREGEIDSATTRFAGLVEAARPAHLAFAHLRFPRESHATTPFVTMVDALRLAFAPLALPGDSVARALLDPQPRDSASVAAARAALERRYAEAATRLAMPTTLPQATLNQLGYVALRAGHKALAVSFFRDNTLRYPTSANTFDSLGDALAEAGDVPGAIAAYDRSTEIAARTGDPVGRLSRGKRNRLEVLRRAQ